MNIIVNGEETTIESSEITVTELLQELAVDMPEMVSVELNENIIPRSKHEDTVVDEGDKIEFLYFMGGGQK